MSILAQDKLESRLQRMFAFGISRLESHMSRYL